MTMLYDVTSSTCLSKYVRFETEQEVSQIVSKSLDGTVYIQIVGEPQKNYNGSVFVTRAEKDLLLKNGQTLMRRCWLESITTIRKKKNFHIVFMAMTFYEKQTKRLQTM